MKAVLFLAVLVLAAQSSPLQEAFRGFVSTLPMDVETKNSVMNDGMECLVALEETIYGLLYYLPRGVQTENYIEAIKVFLYTEQIFEHKIAPVCFMTYSRIVRFFQENHSRPQLVDMDSYDFDYTKYVVQNQLFSAKMIQTLARAVQDLSYYRGFEAGEKFATFLMIGHGMANPELPDLNKFTRTTYVPFDQEKFFNEFIPGFLREIRIDEESITGCVSCARELVNATQRALSNPALHGRDFLPGLTAFLEGALMITDSLQKCQTHVDLSSVGEVVGYLARYPLQFYVRFLMNDLLNKLEVTEGQWTYATLAASGEYSLAGKELAKILKTELRGILF